MRIAHINAAATTYAGHMAVRLCRMAAQAGHKALFCHSHDYAPSDIYSYRIGSLPSNARRVARTNKGLKRVLAMQADRLRCHYNTVNHLRAARWTDGAGFFSKRATERLVAQLELFKPDIVHLHTLHGYYLHLPTLFAYLKKYDMPVVWTLHDSWAYTGHCACYTAAVDAPPIGVEKRHRAETHTTGCDRWQAGCGKCVLKRSYPATFLRDRSKRNWARKRELFQGLNHMILTTPSTWLRDEVKLSFLKDYPVYVLPVGVEAETYRPCPSDEYMHHAAQSYGLDHLEDRKLVLSVADVWDEVKGLYDLIELSQKLGPEYCVAAVGPDRKQTEDIPQNTVMSLRQPGNVNDLCALYTAADVYVSTARDEASAMPLLQALACGTQVACYDAASMPEYLTDEVGESVAAGDTDALADAVRRLCQNPHSSRKCIDRALEFDAADRSAAYMRLYEKVYRFSPAYRAALEEAAGKTARGDE